MLKNIIDDVKITFKMFREMSLGRWHGCGLDTKNSEGEVYVYPDDPESVSGRSENWGQAICYLRYNRMKLINSNLPFTFPLPIPSIISLLPGGLERDSRS